MVAENYIGIHQKKNQIDVQRTFGQVLIIGWHVLPAPGDEIWSSHYQNDSIFHAALEDIIFKHERELSRLRVH